MPTYSLPNIGDTGWGTTLNNYLNEMAGVVYGPLSGDVTGNLPAITLKTISGLTAGTYGSASAIPQISVNGKGLITAVSTANVTVPGTITGDKTFTGSVAVNGGLSIGDADTDVTVDRSISIHTDNRTTTYTYTGSQITSVVITSAGTTVKTINYTYSGSNISTMVEVVGGHTITTTYNYTGSEITSITKAGS